MKAALDQKGSVGPHQVCMNFQDFEVKTDFHNPKVIFMHGIIRITCFDLERHLEDALVTFNLGAKQCL